MNKPSEYLRLKSKPAADAPPQGSVDLFHDPATSALRMRRPNGVTVALGGGAASAEDVLAALAADPSGARDALNVGAAVIPVTANFIFEGDSITAGANGAAAWPTLAADLSNFAARGTLTNRAVSGSTIATMAARYAAQVEPLAPTGDGIAYLFVLIGINDHAAGSYASAALHFAALEAYWDTAIADGFRVVALTVLPKKDTIYAYRTQVNALIRASTKPWAVIDLDAAFPDASDTNVYQAADGLHLTDFGAQCVAERINADLSAGELRSPQRPFNAEQNRLAVGTVTPRAGMHAIATFGFRVGNVETDNTQKLARYHTEPYASPASVPVAAMLGVNNAGGNELRVGGGDTAAHSTTFINFWTAASIGTVTGTERMRLNSNGALTIGANPSAATTAYLNLSGSNARIAYSTSTLGETSNGYTGLSPGTGSVITGSTSGAMLVVAPINSPIEFGASTSGFRAVVARIKPSGVLQLLNAPTYADNATALAGSLVAGDVYKTATGELRIVV